MLVKLKVLHGTLQDRRGESAGAEVPVRGRSFVIGSSPDCSMCCRSRAISPRHCELRIESSSVFVRDLSSETGTFVNDQQVEGERKLETGDRLRVGRLEFELLIDAASGQPVSASGSPKADPVADYVSDLLVGADEEDRARRLEDPASRHFHLEPNAKEEVAGAKTATSDQDADSTAKRKRPPKKPPAKLPPPPRLVADNTVEAAEETLKKIFTRDKK